MAESVIKRHPWRFAFTLFAALVLIRIVSIAFPNTIPGPPQLEKRTAAMLESYSKRNRWIADYLEREPRTQNADYIRSEIRRAEALGESIRTRVGDSSKYSEVKNDVVQYMAHQCNISQKFGSAMNRNQLWINASFSREYYNKAISDETSLWRKVFGGSATAPDCSR